MIIIIIKIFMLKFNLIINIFHLKKKLVISQICVKIINKIVIEDLPCK